MSAATSTDFAFFDNKDSDIFGSAIDQSDTNFFDAFINDDSDAFDSSGTSNGSSIFDAVDLGFCTSQSESSFADSSSSGSTKDQYQAHHTWRANPWTQHTFDTPPASRKLVHHMRQDGLAISGMELLSLEGISGGNQNGIIRIHSPPGTSSDALAPKKINRESLKQNNNCKVSKPQVHSSIDLAKMMRPSIYRKYTPPSLDYMHDQDGQYNLQRVTVAPSNQLPNPSQPQAKTPSTPSLKRRPTIPQYQRQLYQAAFPMANAPTNNVSHPTTSQHSRHPTIWMQPNQPLFALSVDDVQMNWASTPAAAMNAYRCNNAVFENQNGPDLSAFASGLESQGPMISCDPYSSYQFSIRPDVVLDDYMISPTSPNFDHSTDTSPEDLCFDSSKFNAGTFSDLTKPLLPLFPTSPSSPSREEQEARSSPQTPTTTRRTRRRHQLSRKSSIATPTTPSTSTSAHRRKDSSTSLRTPRSKSSFSTSNTSRTSLISPSTPSTSSPSFVNFTPEDKLKILTGVAPSGSSKTKARREREEREKERRMSEIAAKAVRDAGGDVEGLRRAGILI